MNLYGECNYALSTKKFIYCILVIIINVNPHSLCHYSYYIVHRDLKLENILVSHATKPIQIKIIDFGLSKIFTINEKMHEKYGTLLYLPPEIVLNDQ